MRFHDFMQSIASPELAHIANHWNEVRGSQGMPGWSDIRPSHIAAQLPLIWVYKYDRETNLFTGRLAGHLIEQVFGKSFRGTPMAELYPPSDYPRLFERARRVTSEPALYRGEGMVFRHVDHFGHGERIMMPLASDGANGDGVFGATIYQSVWGKAADDIPEREVWFAL
jgi:hypothetical protein